MKEKIQLLIKNEGLTQSRLAEMLEIQPANVSHILAGRSKPGFELLQKILRRFPRINPDWLLLDSPAMYREKMEPSSLGGDEPSAPLGSRPAPNFDSLFPGALPAPPLFSSSPEGLPTQPTTTAEASAAAPTADPRPKVARVVVFYSDHTFESFEPKG